jgi:protein-S-isoprenylcysteine O-methyltransferase Ste14
VIFLDARESDGRARRSARFAFAYGVAAYLVFVAVLGYAVAFMAGLGGSRSVPGAPVTSPGRTLMIDLALLSLFGLQHSIMARRAFKRWWTRVVPATVERSTYVLASSVALALAFWQWRSMPGAVWSVAGGWGRALIWGAFAIGSLIVVLANTTISHLELFGIRRVWMRLRGRPYEALPLRTDSLYAVVRHPMALGLVIALWAAPDMTWDRFVFAAAGTGYTFLGTWLEERDLVHTYPTLYPRYRREVPMFVPASRWRARTVRRPVAPPGAHSHDP